MASGRLSVRVVHVLAGLDREAWILLAGISGYAGLGLAGVWLGVGGRRFEREKRRVKGDIPLFVVRLKADDGAQGIAGFARDGEDDKIRFSIRIDGDPFIRVFPIEQGHAVSTGDGRDADKRVIIERVGFGARGGRGRFGGEGRIRPQTGVAGDRCFFRQFGGGHGGTEEEKAKGKFHGRDCGTFQTDGASGTNHCSMMVVQSIFVSSSRSGAMRRKVAARNWSG